MLDNNNHITNENSEEETLFVSATLGKKGKKKNSTQKYKITTDGVTENTYNTLKSICGKRFGRIDNKSMGRTLGLLIKQFVIDSNNPCRVNYDPHGRIKNKRVRLEVRISPAEYAYLQQMAAKQENTSTGIILGLIRQLIKEDKVKNKEKISLLKEVRRRKRVRHNHNYSAWLQS